MTGHYAKIWNFIQSNNATFDWHYDIGQAIAPATNNMYSIT